MVVISFKKHEIQAIAHSLSKHEIDSLAHNTILEIFDKLYSGTTSRIAKTIIKYAKEDFIKVNKIDVSGVYTKK